MQNCGNSIANALGLRSLPLVHWLPWKWPQIYFVIFVCVECEVYKACCISTVFLYFSKLHLDIFNPLHAQFIQIWVTLFIILTPWSLLNVSASLYTFSNAYDQIKFDTESCLIYLNPNLYHHVHVQGIVYITSYDLFWLLNSTWQTIYVLSYFLIFHFIFPMINPWYSIKQSSDSIYSIFNLLRALLHSNVLWYLQMMFLSVRSCYYCIDSSVLFYI